MLNTAYQCLWTEMDHKRYLEELDAEWWQFWKWTDTPKLAKGRALNVEAEESTGA